MDRLSMCSSWYDSVYMLSLVATLCVCVRVRACVRACVHACVRVCVRVSVCLCLYVRAENHSSTE